ncbi:TolC family protein [Balneolaceae bacterium YR4-1]|uniref:TolC family protein n=2 Tax=Halalkalibaculum roseum TaxID=2709311 RepID=A0A6M1T476_9BACT|nr:TolC family protein [Halalkalibaculum roseum]
MFLRLLLAGIVLVVAVNNVSAQDTVKVSLQEFIEIGINNSGQLDFEQQKVSLAENRIDQAQNQRYLPRFDLSTQHGLVPGVKSNVEGLDPNEFYLDPDLENDWEDIGVFTRAEVNAIQPIFAWGGLRSLVKAARAGAESAKEQFESQQSNIEIRLYELYESYLLSVELQRLLDEANGKIEDIGEQIEEQRESGDSELDESDVFKFEIFKSEFAIRAAEVNENIAYIKSIWSYVTQSDENTIYMPDLQFLDPVGNSIQELDYYRTHAIQERAEVKAIEAGIEAAEYGLDATKAQNYPTLFLGLSGSYANTPNRPRQSNPFIINNSNYASAAFGIGIRQNLDFFSMKADVERSNIQYNQAKYLKDAAVDGIVLEINDKYKNASLSKVKVDRTDEALVTSKKWLRQEQLDYDFGMGDTKDLIDAMQKELELKVQLKREIFEFNKNMAELYKASGMDITTLKLNNN